MEVSNMKNTIFSLLDQLELPCYERRFEDINLNYVFSNEEVVLGKKNYLPCHYV